ncbi:MAG: VWA domain-containing protein [Acidilobaceae archaeon]|nr:VWA domain-containing protein [Acidilobaceae archaeon]
MSAKDIAIALDISLSMGDRYSDLVPSRLEASKEVIAVSGSRALQAGSRIALALFHERPIPLLPLTAEYRALMKALAEVNFVREGSALGDGIVEAVKLLRSSKREKVVIAFTDGGVTEGVPLRAAALYAKFSNARLSLLILNREVRGDVAEDLRAAAQVGAEIHMVDSKQRLLSLAFETLRL